MKTIKPIITLFIVTSFVIIMIPAMLVLPFSTDKADGKLSEKLVQPAKKKGEQMETIPSPAVEVAVYRSVSKNIQKLPLETYIVGVVAAEMPADFKLEALKAQALTARTYIVNQLLAKDAKELPNGANVTDTVNHQVYKNNDELKQIWGSDYKWKIKKITKAVEDTNGQILTYDGKPITASFFSTSNGYTENSEAYWGGVRPYLKSVSSPWDKISPKFYNTTVLSITDFERKLGVKVSNEESIGTVTARTPGKRVGTITIGGKKLTGKEIRETLDLKSADFSWERKGNNIIISTKGYGHGVGMSQYGANGMALEGKNYEDIVKYYYKGVTIQSSNNLLNTTTAKR
ncbi:stage II sporulation protein D [Peribacillus cavernae]|uniref:Stage II sporulation protein D n=1 Tax=Peribacillus cavernae TaxID=1674310 RepID=A0A3S0W2X2_9BACI|nr:stage II sporulation protein D [Peribacillus cavernae]MDQ0218488.1 stage II sporulation protein D [Peribacillus cavernae]RUQ31482.1 stage II sporulation protein D [Peribacillus cavernae]